MKDTVVLEEYAKTRSRRIENLKRYGTIDQVLKTLIISNGIDSYLIVRLALNYTNHFGDPFCIRLYLL